nr:reverse transcriptase domain-containing protein [Tanacetum cinerariifolium]
MEGESFRAFITRYAKETAQIIRLDEDQRIASFIHGVKIKSLFKFISTELPEGYDGLMDKVYSWLQAEETTSEGRPVTFMDGVEGEKPQKGRPWEGVGRRNKERRDKKTIVELGMIPSTMNSAVLYLSEIGPRVIISEYEDMRIYKKEKRLKESLCEAPFQQKKRGMAPKRSTEVAKEVKELKRAGILRETRYQTWVAYIVMVKRTDEAWRMWVDFTNINKACPKDYYSLPKIDWKVDSIFDFKLKCFLDAYKGYYKRKLVKEDEHKTTFHASKGVYCYKKMPFELKNTGATYKRVVDKVFERYIVRKMEAYVDDMVIKSMNEADIITDIHETFERLRQINMKLNPKNALLE